jgi:hypothetical protein
MVADGMLTRKRYREVPPRVDYALTDRARELMPVLGELARWGYAWAWSSPRASEDVDLGAIFRLAAGLVHPDGRRGTVEFAVEDSTKRVCYAFTLGPEELTMRECDTDGADARVAGDRNAWINAFSPARDHSGLTFSGDRQLAAAVLGGLSGEKSRPALRTADAA